MSGTLLLVDSASLYFRAYYALPDSMVTADGRPNNALRGFLQMLTRLVERHQPTALACCWDDDWRPQWRVDALLSYKAHRVADGDDVEVEETPDALSVQAEALAELLDALSIARPGALGFEADDCIGTLAAQWTGPVVIASGDRDMVQLVGEHVHLHLATSGGMEKWPMLDPEAVLARYGVRPEQYVDLAVLRGDPSDGIPGVPGIGEKTATKLLAECGSIADILALVDAGTPPSALTPRLAKVLAGHRELIATMRTVATIRTDAPWSGDVRIPDLGQVDARAQDIVAAWNLERFVTPFVEALLRLER